MDIMSHVCFVLPTAGEAAAEALADAIGVRDDGIEVLVHHVPEDHTSS